MQDKILSVFYGEDRLPYKDASRETHYPIVNGNVFNGANNVTKIRYYLDRIGGFTNVTWVVVSKLPNGQLASEVLNSNNAVYDEELGEHYIDFEISSYYTTLKGDVYLSLQGYQGGVEMEQDEDTGIYSIYGTPTIQATGSIKIGVNYAPQIVQGTHFTTSDLQQVLGLISEKANISDVVFNFGIIPNIITLSQLYGLVNSSNKPCVIDFGGYKFGLIAWLGGSNYSFEFSDVRGIGRWVGTSVNASTLLTDIFTTTSTYYQPYATQEYVESNYVKPSDLVYTRGNYLVTDIATTTISDIYSNVDTSETFRVGGSNVLFRGTYLLEKGSNLGSNYNFKIICIEHDSVDMIGRYWETTLGGVAPTTTLQTIFNNLLNTLATTKYVDNKIADFMQKEYQNVDTTTYPTLDDFLASTGTEGYIYLYPTGVNNDYYQYIWENNGWVSLGTTQLELSNYYTKTQADDKFATITYVDNEIDEIDDKLETKANVDGNYPTMTVGSADSLTPYGENSGASDTTPFVFQSSGGSSDVGVKAYLRALRGNSVAFNQLIDYTAYSLRTQTINGITFTNNNDGSITANGTASANTSLQLLSVAANTKGKLLIKGCPSGGSSSTYSIYDINVGSARDTGNGSISNSNTNLQRVFAIYIYSGTTLNNVVFKPQIFDLRMFEQSGKTYNSVLEFNRDYPKPYYEYNAGSLLSCKSNGIKNVGYNAFDGELEIGGFDNQNIYNCHTKNYIKVIPGQTYSFENGDFTTSETNGFYYREYDGNFNLIGSTISKYAALNSANKVTEITLSNETHYIKFMLFVSHYDFTDNYPTKLSIHLTWDSSRTGYEPYESETYPLPNVELRSAGSVYDELKPDGTLIRRIGVVDLGTLTWNNNESFASGLFSATVSGMNNTTESSQRNKGITCSKYIPSSVTALNNNIPDKSMLRYNGGIFIRDSAFEGKTTDEVKSLVNGIYLNYELATLTEEQTEYTFAETTPIDDYGTQEFLYDSDIAIPVPQGNEFFYPVDYKAFIDSLGGRDDIEYAADQVVSQTQLTQALSTFLSSISGYDATKTQTLKNVSGVFQWVDD